MAVLPAEASYEQFCEYITDLKGPQSDVELADLWSWRQKLTGIRFNTERAFRAQLPADEQHLTREERGRKTAAEAKATGRNIERLPDKTYF